MFIHFAVREVIGANPGENNGDMAISVREELRVRLYVNLFELRGGA